MPVKKNWYRVESLVNKRSIGGISEYKVKFEGYAKLYWVPFYNITPDLVEDYEQEKREQNAKARELRWQQRQIKKELG